MSHDSELIRRYRREGDEEAFKAIVERYLNLVYSTALRLVHDSHLAEDISQTVFLKLARRAGQLPDSLVLAGWLHSDTRLTALQLLRAEKRRLNRESHAMQTYEPDADWAALRPLIDEALGDLDPVERDAVLLRFFGDRSFAEVGAALRLAPDAARMRVNRAVEKLREALERRGLTTTAATLSATLLVHSVQAAPGSLGDSIALAARRLQSTEAPITGTHRVLTARRVAIGFGLAGIALTTLFLRPRAPEQPPAPAAVEAPVPAAHAPPMVAAVSAATPPQQERRRLRLKVVDEETGVPLAAVKVDVSTFTDVVRSARESLSTDANGMVEFSYPTLHNRDFYHRAQMQKDGYVPRVVSWSKYQMDAIESIPAEYTATLPKGIQIGGIVRGTAGECISGAKVILGGSGPIGYPERERDTVMSNYHTEVTDSQGQWRCTHVRPEFQTLTFTIEHPEYQSAIFGCQGTKNPAQVGVLRLRDDDYRSGKALMTLTRGLQISGIVIEKGGAGIGSAVITVNREWKKDSSTAQSDSGGAFKIDSARPGPVILTAAATGFAPMHVNLVLTSNVAAVRFELCRSAGVRGRVLNQSGMPLQNAELEFDTERYQRIYDWRQHTDEFGGFFWDSSPNEPFRVSVFAFGFVRTNVLLHPGNDEQIITLASLPVEEPVTIRGTVVETAGGQPVDGAEVYLQDWMHGDVPPHRITAATNGQFSFKLDNRELSYQLEIRAESFAPAQSKTFRLSERLEPFEFRLERAENITGVVLAPDGQPVEGAEVALCTREHRATLGKRSFLFPEQSLITRTDTSGRFTHPRRFGAHHLYVVHNSGYAEARLKGWDPAGVLQLQPWARLEGQLTVGGQPAPHEQIFIHPAFWHGIEWLIEFYGISAITDESGRFAIDDLPPIEVRVEWARPVANGMTSSHPVNVRLAPGKTSRIDYTISGMTVTGKLVWEGEGEVDWRTQARGSLMPRIAQKPWELAPGYAEATPERRRAIEAEFPYTEAGREHMRAQRYVPIMVEADGRFTISFVQPGDYTLRAWVQAKPQTRFTGTHLASFEREITLPPDADSIDVGAMPLTPKRQKDSKP